MSDDLEEIPNLDEVYAREVSQGRPWSDMMDMVLELSKWDCRISHDHMIPPGWRVTLFDGDHSFSANADTFPRAAAIALIRAKRAQTGAVQTGGGK